MRIRNILNKVNFPLIIGLCIVLLLAAVSLYPERFATSDPYGKQITEYEQSMGKIFVPPVSPGKEYPWGTDEKGRDLRSLVIYGTSATMTIALGVALARLIIALPLAFAAAYKRKAAGWIIDFFNTVFSAFPLIVLILILTTVDLFNDVFSNPMISAAFIMSAFGWSKLAKLLTKTVEDVLRQDFIEGEIAIGKTRLDIIIQNVIPHIIPAIVVFFFLEVAVVLLLLAQVGVLGLVLTGGLTEDGNLRVPYEFDWASLLVFSGYLFDSSKIWMIKYPAIAFAFSIVGYNMFGEGLRIEFEKRDSRVITFIKRVPGYISPLKYIYELRNFSKYKRIVYCKSVVVMLVLLIAFFPNPQSRYPFDSVTAFETVLDIGSSEFKYREYKADRNIIAVDYLSAKLEQYGIQPFDNKYIHEMLTREDPEVTKAEISAKSKDGAMAKLDYKKDFITAAPVAADGTFKVVKLDRTFFADHSKIMKLSGSYNDNVLLIDARGMEYTEFNSITSDIKYFLKPRGVIFIEDWNSGEGRGDRTIYLGDMENIFSILMAGDKGEELLKQQAFELAVKIDVQIVKQVLNANVMGIIPGKDPVLKNDIIIIGTTINNVVADMGNGNHQALSTEGVAMELELARLLGSVKEKPDRTIIFAFWDESNRFNKGAKAFSEKYIDRSKNNVFYIDIGDLDRKVLLVDSSGIKPTSKSGQLYIRSLKQNIDNNDVKAVFRSINNSSTATFMSGKQQVLAFDSANPKYVEETRKKRQTDEIAREDLIKFHNIGQMIIDTVFDIIYDEKTN